jgi:DNA-binding MarR family transcriptional regulator
MTERRNKGSSRGRAGEVDGLAPETVETRSIDEWLSFRFAVIATRVSTISHGYSQRTFQLSGHSWRGLALLARFGPCSAKQLVEKSSFDYPKVSRIIEDLVSRQLIERRNDSQDQRRAELNLTPQGRKVYENIAHRATEFEEYITSTLTKTERTALWSAIGKIDVQIAEFFARPASGQDQ